jgi:hypothetical protein
VYAGRKTNFYAEVNGTASGEHRVDDEVEHRAGNEGLRREIIAAQDRVTAALGEQKPLYFALEELVGNRIAVREEAHFNVGFEHGYIEGRQEALSAVWRRTTRGRTLAKKITHLALDSRLAQHHAIGALLEVAWSLLTRPHADAVTDKSKVQK